MSVEGMVSLRGALVPVIDLAKYAGIQTDGKARHHDRHRIQRSHPGFPGQGGGQYPASGLVGDARTAGDAGGRDGWSGHCDHRTEGWSSGDDDGRGKGVVRDHSL